MPIDPSQPNEVTLEGAGRPPARYTLIEQLGEGGFGTVWKARQDHPVRRMVAVKVIKPGMDSREVMARFALERQALALMEHPGIATVFDAGVAPDGRPFFVMELVQGPAVTQFCDDHRLDANARLRLMLEICSAVQHAHQKGIIHRDLKPANLLVAGSADHPQPKIIDFGVARALDRATEGHSILTGEFEFIGTPACMSPEQASLGGVDIDTRSDIYALGVLLYQLLTGTTPFAEQTAGATPEEVRRIIRDEAPPAPSTAIGRLKGETLTSVTAARRTALGDLGRLLRRDLDWIVIKALEKDRERRYQTVAAFAADIGRYLEGAPVLAHPPTMTYRAGKLIRRHKGRAAAAAAVLVSLTSGIAASTTMRVRETAAVNRETTEREKVIEETMRVRTESAKNEQTAQFLSDMLAGINPDVARGADLTQMKRILAAAAAKVGTDLQGQPRVEAFLRNTLGSTYFTIGLYPEAKVQFDEGLEVAAADPGPEARLTLNLRGNRANVLDSQGEYAEAERENRAILALRERVLGETDRETLATRANLANVIGAQQRYKEAEDAYETLVDLQKTALGANNLDTLRSRVALANTRRVLGRDMVDEYRAAIADLESVPGLGRDHPDTLAARYGLADALSAAGKFPDAEAEHEAVWKERERVLGPSHKKTLRSRMMIGQMLLAQRKPAEAAGHFRAVLEQQEIEVQKGRLRPDHPDILNNRISLAAATGELGEPAEAEGQLRAVIAVMEPRASPGDTTLLTCRYNLALALADQGKLDEAEDLQRQVLATCEATLDPSHRYTLRSMKGLIEILRKQGKSDQAADLTSRMNRLRPRTR